MKVVMPLVLLGGLMLLEELMPLVALVLLAPLVALAMPGGLAHRLVETACATAQDLLHRDRLRPSRLAFALARELRGVEGATIVPVKALLPLIRPAVAEFWAIMQQARWIQQASEPWTSEDLLVDVAATWDKVRVPGGDALATAFRKAKSRPLALAPSLPGALTLVVSTACYLQQYRGEYPIQLPRKRLAALLGCNPRRVSALVQLAVKLGLLLVVEDNYSYAGGKAKTYRFSFLLSGLHPSAIPSTGAPYVKRGRAASSAGTE